MAGKIREIWSKLRVWGLVGAVDCVSKKLAWRRTARRLRKISKLDEGAKPERGITLIGDFAHGASNSKTNRDFAHALKEAGIPYQTFSIDRENLVPECDYAGVLTPPEDFRLHRYTHVVEMFRSPMPRDLVKRRARVAFWEGEHGILDVWPFLGGSDPVIAMSDFNAEYFRREFKAPVYKILYPLRPVDVAIPPPREVRRRHGIGPDDFMVLFIFDFGSYRRKNPLAAMRAFAEALGGAPDARLVFKTMGARLHRAEVAELENEARRLGIADRFVHIPEYLPHADLYGLAAACDVYISLHRGEGFGIGMAEAMLAGKPVVATDWSANTEYCRPGSSFPVKCTLAPVRPGDYFTSMREWAEPDVADAARILAECHADRAMAASVGAKGKAFVEEHFSAANFKKSVEDFLDGRVYPGKASSPPPPKVTIVTVVRNAAGKIGPTIGSVLAQTYGNVEYIVIDGKSDDGTMNVVNRYRDRIDVVVSEPDDGLYEALNKGVMMATGDWIGVMNAGDAFAAPDVLERVFGTGSPQCDVVFGDAIAVDGSSEIFYPAHEDPAELAKGPSYRHGASFVKSAVHRRFLFDVSKKGLLGFALDYEQMHRMYKEGCSFLKVDFPVLRYELRGISTASPFAGTYMIYLITHNLRCGAAMRALLALKTLWDGVFAVARRRLAAKPRR